MSSAVETVKGTVFTRLFGGAKAEREGSKGHGGDASGRGTKKGHSRGGAGSSRKTVASGGAGRHSIADEVSGRIMSTPASLMGPRLGLIVVVVLLCAIGLVMVFSASSIYAYYWEQDAAYYFTRQAIFTLFGAILCVGAAWVPYTIWSKPVAFISLWVVTCLILGATVLGVGLTGNGAERAISIGGFFTLQPAEIAKVTLVLSIASLVAMYREGQIAFRPFFGCLCVAVIVPIALIYLQPDLGTAIIVLVGVLALLFLSGCPRKYIGIFVALVAVYVVVVCIAQPYHIDRILTMLDPWRDPYGDGRQSIQSQYAFGKGGIFGLGLGNSRQKYLYLSECHTDFIFSIIGEELGLIGALIVVVLFALFVFFGLRIARSAPDLFGCMVAGACTAMIGFQACVNMGQACGILPVTGKALPFISYGGSSLVGTLLMVGLILSVSIHSKVGAAHDRRRDNLVVLEGGGSARGGSGSGGGSGRGGSGSGGGSGRGGLRVVPGGRAARKDGAAGGDGSQATGRTKRAASTQGRSGNAQRGSGSQRGGSAQRAGSATRKRTFDASAPDKKASGRRRTRSSDAAVDPGSSGRLSYPGRDMSGRYASRTNRHTGSGQRHRDDE